MILLAALIAGAAIAGGIAIATSASSGQTAPGSSSIPAPIAQFATQSSVTGLQRHGPGLAGGFGWYSGTDATGRAVVTVGSTQMLSPFVPLQQFLDSLQTRKLDVFSADAGATVSTVDSREVAGVVSSDVSRIDFVLEGGGTVKVAVVDQAFDYTAVCPAAFPTMVIAYDATGAIAATNTLLAPSAPG